MQIRVIGSSGSELPGRNLPAFLIDDFLLMDAGTIGLSLNRAAQDRITHILLSHAHLDHIKGIAFFVDNIVSNRIKHSVTVLSGGDVLKDLRENIFNNKIWPDFTAIPSRKNPVLRFKEIKEGRPVRIGDYRVYATRVSHTVAAYGYIIKDRDGRAVVYTGDTGPTEALWKRMQRHDVKVLIIEVSMPDSMKRLAIMSGHLTPSLLAGEIRKMKNVPQEIYITHVKPQFMETIEMELSAIKDPFITILSDNNIITV